MAIKHKQIDYSTSIGDLMSGLAIFFILLFVCLIVSQRQNVNDVKDVREIEVTKKYYRQSIESYLKEEKLNCPDNKTIQIKPLKGSIGVYITTEGLFKQASSDFENESKKIPLKCILTSFLKSVVLNRHAMRMNKLDYVMIESKGDFFINSGFTSVDLIKNKNGIFRKQFELTLDRTKTVFNLLLDGMNFEEDEMAYINAHLGGSGLSWSEHYRSLKASAKQGNLLVDQKADKSERSIQVRLIVKGLE